MSTLALSVKNDGLSQFNGKLNLTAPIFFEGAKVVGYTDNFIPYSYKLEPKQMFLFSTQQKFVGGGGDRP